MIFAMVTKPLDRAIHGSASSGDLPPAVRIYDSSTLGPCFTMCYGVYLSTDSPKDLTGRNSELVRFVKVTDPGSDPCIALLNFENTWYVESKSGCSCTFRHLHTSSVQLGFSEPVDWYPEEQDEVDATRELHKTLSEILSAGHQVDVLDRWEGAQPDDITTLDVSLDEVPERAFRMFEDHRFRLKKRPQRSSAPDSGLRGDHSVR